MDTDIDWRRELEASFGTAPDEPVGTFVAAGHRAVRRRRAVAVVAGLGAAAVVAGMAWGTAPGGSPRGADTPVASDPNGMSQAADDPLAWRPGDPPARFIGNGAEIRDGAVVHERRDDLYPGKSTSSLALDVSFGGERWWVSMEWDGDAGTSQSMQPEDGLFEDFDAFVRDRVRGGGMITRPARDDEQQPWGGLVAWNGGELAPLPGVDVLRVVDDPLPSADDSVGVVLRDGGETTWMLITLAPSGGSASSTKESETGWATFDEWLADQVAMIDGDTAPNPVRLQGGTVVAAEPGVEVVDQQADPDLRAYGTEAESTVSAVALVEWQGDRWFVFALRIDGQDSVTTVSVDKAGGATTLDQFVAFMTDKADEGGMR